MHLLCTRGSALSLRLVWELYAVLVRAGGQVPVAAAPRGASRLRACRGRDMPRSKSPESPANSSSESS